MPKSFFARNSAVNGLIYSK